MLNACSCTCPASIWTICFNSLLSATAGRHTNCVTHCMCLIGRSAKVIVRSCIMRLIITTRSTKYCCARLWLLTWSLSMKCWSCIVTLLRSLFVRFMIIPRRIKRYGISPQLMKVMTHGVNRRNHHHHRRRHHQNHHLGRRFKWIRSWDETQVLLNEGKQPSCKQPMDQQGILMTCPLTGRSHDAIRPTSCTTRRKDCPSDIKHINISLGFRLNLNMKNFWSGSIVGIQG